MFFQSLFIFIYLLVLLNNIILSYLYLLFYIYLNNIIIIKCRFLGHHHIVFIIFNFGFINALFSLISGLGKSGIITLSLCIYWLVLFSISLVFILNNIILLLSFLPILLILLYLLLINNIIPITPPNVLIYSSLLSILFLMNGLLSLGYYLFILYFIFIDNIWV